MLLFVYFESPACPTVRKYFGLSRNRVLLNIFAVAVMSGGNVAIKRRKELRKELALIEKQIFDLETTYLEETKEVGNIFSGWGAYLAPLDKVPKKKAITSDERLFSLSSITSPAIRIGDEGGGDKKKRKG